MPSPLEQAGAVKEPSEYATLSMDRHITGLWTQRSPLRDADVPYNYSKGYNLSRFDSLIDGLNREMSARLTTKRRAGCSVYNSNTFPAIDSFYSYKRIVDGAALVRVMADGQDGVIYDATAGQKTALFTKAAGAGKARFLGLNTSLFFSDGVEEKKWLRAQDWQASTKFSPGTLINQGGKLQMALGGIDLTVNAFSSDGTYVTLYVDPLTVPLNFANLINVKLHFSGFSTATFLNGINWPVFTIVSSTLGIFKLQLAHAVTAKTADTGAATTGNGITGGSAPAFSAIEFLAVDDSGQQWKCYGDQVENWGLSRPTLAPTLQGLNGTRFWQKQTAVAQYYAILDINGNVQAALLGAGTTGIQYPNFSVAQSGGGITADGTVLWSNLGTIGAWDASTLFQVGPLGSASSVILDSNGNLQVPSIGGTSGGSEPVWATVIGTTTPADGSVTWTCLGPGNVLYFRGVSYGFSTHGVDGSVSTASPTATILGGVLGPAVDGTTPLIRLIRAFAYASNEQEVDQLWIWRTAQGQPTLVLEDQISVVNLSGGLLYDDYGIPDTSIDGGGALTPQVPAPVGLANNPPPAGITAPAYHMGRTFAIYKNAVVWSGGPDTVVGNGNTAFKPTDNIPFTDQPVRLVPITVQNGGLLVICQSTIRIILGTGTAGNPFYETNYFAGVGILNYDAVSIIGSTLYLMEGNGLVSSLDPGAGYTEYGFPIGDQFEQVTTGASVGAFGGAVDPTFAEALVNAVPNTVLVNLYVLGDSLPAWVAPGANVKVVCSDTRFNNSNAVITATGGAVSIAGRDYFFFSYVQSGTTLVAQEPVTATATEYLGPPLGRLYDPATTYVAWANLGPSDKAVYVADGNVGWFRYSPVASPESGYMWSPRAVIAGGTSAVQSVETTPGNYQLLIGPPNDGGGGVVRFRDAAMKTDMLPSGTSSQTYASWDVKGNIVLCQSGEVAEIAHIALKSMAVGERPRVGLLLSEITPTDQVPWDWLERTSADPPDLVPSTTVYSDRYSALQNGVTPKCDNFQLAIDYGSQDADDELLMFSIYGATYAERRQQ